MLEVLRDVYRKHRQGLFSVALMVTGCRQQAEDAVQTAFAKLANSPRMKGDPVPYVFRAVRYAAIDIRRADQRERKLMDSLFNGYSAGFHDNSPDAHALTKERDQILRRAIADLPEDEREAITLKALAGLTFQQAGETAGIPAKTLATRYRRALEKLRFRLRDEE